MVVADGESLIPGVGVLPDDGQVFATVLDNLVRHPVGVVPGIGAVAVAAETTVVAPFAHHPQRLGEVRLQGAHHLLDDASGLEELLKQMRFNLPTLRTKYIPAALHHVATQHQDTFVNRVVFALDVGEADDFIGELGDAPVGNLNVVGRGLLA